MSLLLLTKSSEPFFSVIQVWLSLLTITLYEVTQSLLLILENQGDERRKRNILSGWIQCKWSTEATVRPLKLNTHPDMLNSHRVKVHLKIGKWGRRSKNLY